MTVEVNDKGKLAKVKDKRAVKVKYKSKGQRQGYSVIDKR